MLKVKLPDGSLREYSRRNLNIMLGEGVVASGSEPADAETTVDTAASATDVGMGGHRPIWW